MLCSSLSKDTNSKFITTSSVSASQTNEAGCFPAVLVWTFQSSCLSDVRKVGPHRSLFRLRAFAKNTFLWLEIREDLFQTQMREIILCSRASHQNLTLKRMVLWLFNLMPNKVKVSFGAHYSSVFQWLCLIGKILPVKRRSAGIFAVSITKQLNGLEPKGCVSFVGLTSLTPNRIWNFTWAGRFYCVTLWVPGSKERN